MPSVAPGDDRPGRQAFAHDAVLVMEQDADDRAPGGAVTVALCGSWSHEPPCPLASHHTRAVRSGDRVSLRILFATAPENEDRVRRLIDRSLAGGDGEDPDGRRITWRLESTGAGTIRPDERDHAERLIRS